MGLKQFIFKYTFKNQQAIQGSSREGIFYDENYHKSEDTLSEHIENKDTVSSYNFETFIPKKARRREVHVPIIDLLYKDLALRFLSYLRNDVTANNAI